MLSSINKVLGNYERWLLSKVASVTTTFLSALSPHLCCLTASHIACCLSNSCVGLCPLLEERVITGWLDELSKRRVSMRQGVLHIGDKLVMQFRVELQALLRSTNRSVSLPKLISLRTRYSRLLAIQMHELLLWHLSFCGGNSSLLLGHF